MHTHGYPQSSHTNPIRPHPLPKTSHAFHKLIASATIYVYRPWHKQPMALHCHHKHTQTTHMYSPIGVALTTYICLFTHVGQLLASYKIACGIYPTGHWPCQKPYTSHWPPYQCPSSNTPNQTTLTRWYPLLITRSHMA